MARKETTDQISYRLVSIQFFGATLAFTFALRHAIQKTSTLFRRRDSRYGRNATGPYPCSCCQIQRQDLEQRRYILKKTMLNLFRK